MRSESWENSLARVEDTITNLQIFVLRRFVISLRQSRRPTDQSNHRSWSLSAPGVQFSNSDPQLGRSKPPSAKYVCTFTPLIDPRQIFITIVALFWFSQRRPRVPTTSISQGTTTMTTTPFCLLGNLAPPTTSLLRGRAQEGFSLRDRSSFSFRNRRSRGKSSSTNLQGWFDGWGGAIGGDNNNAKNSTAGGKSKKGSGGAQKAGGGETKKKPHPVGKPKPARAFGGTGGAGNFGTSIKKDETGKEKSVATTGGSGGDEINKPRTDLGASAQALAVAAGETFTGAVNSVQERLSQALPQNVTLVWGGGASTNVTVPWKGIGIYAGGLLSGLAVAGALLTLPYTDLGSAGLRKSLTLFENVLLDIDQVRSRVLIEGRGEFQT